jgi:H+/Cl- antiporter ClcA
VAAQAASSAARPGAVMEEVLIGVVFLAGFIALFAGVLYLCRAAARKLLRKNWTHWYVRRAVDSTIVGFCFLLIGVLSGGKGNSRLSEDMNSQINSLWHRAFSGRWSAEDDPRRETARRTLWHLQELANLKWFLDNFFLFTVFPAFAVAFIGYSIERDKSKTQSGAKP